MTRYPFGVQVLLLPLLRQADETAKSSGRLWRVPGLIEPGPRGIWPQLRGYMPGIRGSSISWAPGDSCVVPFLVMTCCLTYLGP